MKKIGFIDYFMSEWHSNNYPAMIRDACARLGLDYEIAYAWSELEDSPDGKSCEAWCREFGVERCATLEEVCERSDVILVLCPGVPQMHLPYARRVLPFKKRTYIDKTFAPSAREAEEIVAIARENGTPMFSTSALRYGPELAGLENIAQVVTSGSGSSAEEYLVHQLEMIVKLMGTGALRVKTEKQGKQGIYRIDYGNGHMATAIYSPSLPFGYSVETEAGESISKEISWGYFETLIERILHFYETGEVDFATEETLCVMKLREQLLANDGEWSTLT